MNTQEHATSCVLLVDDERDFARGLARLISGKLTDVDAVPVHGAREALDVLAQRPVHLMITDLRMPEMSGLQLLSQALAIQPGLSMVILTAYGTIETAVEALQAGAYDFLTKPIEPALLFRVVEKGLERSRLLEENSRLRELLSSPGAADLVGEGAAMERLRKSIVAVAQSSYTVLIRGESGTGKELVARLVHQWGARAGKPFVAVNCPSIPENLLESELFGYMKGAFTGADRDHPGLFAAARSGTIHLDEIGDISLAMQTKLLRVLQDGEVRPVGANRSVCIDTRVVASTNQDLEAGLKARVFREDLYYRLNVLTLVLPPLRERLEDIPQLTRHFLNKSCVEMGRHIEEVDPQVLQWMGRHSWPGNVRELQNFVRRLVVFCSGPVIDMRVLRNACEDVLGSERLMPTQGPGGALLGPYKQAKADVVYDFTQKYVGTLLRQTRGNVSEAARISGLSRVALQKILARMGESAARFRTAL